MIPRSNQLSRSASRGYLKVLAGNIAHDVTAEAIAELPDIGLSTEGEEESVIAALPRQRLDRDAGIGSGIASSRMCTDLASQHSGEHQETRRFRGQGWRRLQNAGQRVSPLSAKSPRRGLPGLSTR